MGICSRGGAPRENAMPVNMVNMEELVDVNGLEGMLVIPEGAKGIVLFVHGSGSSRHSPRNQAVAKIMQEGGLATLLMDLLTKEEEAIDLQTRELRFDIPMLAERVSKAIDWIHERYRDLRIGLIGSSTGAAAALVAASHCDVQAVVSRGGRPDLAMPNLPEVSAPTLLIVGSHDLSVLELNRQAFDRLDCKKRLDLVQGATHLFEEPGTLEKASKLGRRWFQDYL